MAIPTLFKTMDGAMHLELGLSLYLCACLRDASQQLLFVKDCILFFRINVTGFCVSDYQCFSLGGDCSLGRLWKLVYH